MMFLKLTFELEKLSKTPKPIVLQFHTTLSFLINTRYKTGLLFVSYHYPLQMNCKFESNHYRYVKLFTD